MPDHLTLTVSPDLDFQQRWSAWQARGLAHERAVQHRLVVAGVMAAAIALAAALVFGLRSW